MSTPADRRRMAALAASTLATSSRLPQRSTDPRESLFGSGNPQTETVQQTIEALVMAKEDKLVFLEYVTCHICNYPFYSDSKEQRKFWMTSCGHVLCSDPNHQHISGTCTKCKRSEIQTWCLEQGLHESLQPWFFSTDTYLRTIDEAWPRLKFQVNQLYRYIDHLKGLAEKRKDKLDEMREGIERLSQYEKSYKDVIEANNQLQQENTDLKRQLALPHAPVSRQPSFTPPQIPQDRYDSNSRASVEQERFAEEIVNGHLSNFEAMPNGYNKRPRPYETPQRPIMGSGRLTLPSEPSRFEHHGGGEGQTPPRSGPVRTNFDRYRHIPSRAAAQTPQPRRLEPQYQYIQRSASTTPDQLASKPGPPIFAPQHVHAGPDLLDPGNSHGLSRAQFLRHSQQPSMKPFVPDTRGLPPIEEYDEELDGSGPPRNATEGY